MPWWALDLSRAIAGQHGVSLKGSLWDARQVTLERSSEGAGTRAGCMLRNSKSQG
jgi:hypothetical protein